MQLVWSAFLATGWLLVKHNSVFFLDMLLNYSVLSILAMWCRLLLHFPVLITSPTRCAPAFSSSSHFAHEICSCIFQSYSYHLCEVLPHFPVLVNSLTRCAPAISSSSHFAHEMCSCNFQSYSYRPCVLQCSRISKFDSIRPCDYAPAFFTVLGLIHV